MWAGVAIHIQVCLVMPCVPLVCLERMARLKAGRNERLIDFE